jgi:AraC-like DNA-binding protein
MRDNGNRLSAETPLPRTPLLGYLAARGTRLEAVRTRRPAASSSDPDVDRLAALIKAYAPHDGVFELRVPGVHVIRRSRTYKDVTHGVQRSALCLVAQGVKSVMVGPDVYQYEPSRMAVYSVDVPVAAQVTRASPSEPYLCLKLELDPQRIANLVLRVYPQGPPALTAGRAVYVGQADPGILNAATRLLEAMVQPGDAELLAPLVIDEILIRLLRSPIGARLARIGLTDSGMYGVVKAVSWLRANFGQPIRVRALAKLANMSAASFHQHFKSVTSMSPLQYQKALRLQEARRLMLSTMMDAGSASRQVGYVSASQFSREYGRFFGSAPTRDIARLRERAGAGADE